MESKELVHNDLKDFIIHNNRSALLQKWTTYVLFGKGARRAYVLSPDSLKRYERGDTSVKPIGFPIAHVFKLNASAISENGQVG